MSRCRGVGFALGEEREGGAGEHGEGPDPEDDGVQADVACIVGVEALAGDDEASGGKNGSGEGDTNADAGLPGYAEFTTIADGVEDAVGEAREGSVEDRVAGYGLARGVVDEDDGVGAFEPGRRGDLLFGSGECCGEGGVLGRGAGDGFGEACGLAVDAAAQDLLAEDCDCQEDEAEEEGEGGEVAGAGGGGGAEVLAECAAEGVGGEGGGVAGGVGGSGVFEAGGVEHLVGVASAEGGGVEVEGEGVEAEAGRGGGVHARDSGMAAGMPAGMPNGARVRTRTPLLRARLTDWARRVVSAARTWLPRAERR